MKINNVGNINALTQDAAKSVKQSTLSNHKDLLNTGGAQNTPQKSFNPQLAQLLSLLNVFPLLSQQKAAHPSSPVLSALLAALVPPSESKALATWIANQTADKALLTALSTLTLAREEDAPSSLKSLLMLLAEQRLSEQSKNGDFHWLFPSLTPEQNPIRVAVKKPKKGKHQRQVWSVTVNLALSNHRHLTATAELEAQTLSLKFATDSQGIHDHIEQALPVLERALAAHNLALSHCELSIADNIVTTTLDSGVNIQV